MAKKTLPQMLRYDYLHASLDESTLDMDPVTQFETWFNEAIAADILSPDAMHLATVDDQGLPDSRVVLLKSYDDAGFIFFTNFASAKSTQLRANPQAAASFWWGALERQIRIRGRVQRIADEESDTYFASRPQGAQLAAWASPQSQSIPNRGDLEKRYAQVVERFTDAQIPRPTFWGGYILVAESIEFWQGRENRLHDRIRFRRDRDGRWTKQRLAP